MAKWGEGDPRWIVEERPDATNVNNWHWSEKNATPWSRTRLRELLMGVKLEGPKGGTVSVTDIVRLDGEATANNRKAKLIFLYEWDIKCKWEGVDPDEEEKIEGEFEVPNLSDEFTADEIDVNVSCKSSSSAADSLKQLMATTGRDRLREAFASYIKELKEEFSKGLVLPTKDSALPDKKQKPPPTVNKDIVKKVKNEVILNPQMNNMNLGTKILTKSLNIKEDFKCTASDLYNALTIPQMVEAFTRGECQMEAVKGGRFVLFGGMVEGQFNQVKAGKELDMKWRMKTYPSGHYSNVKMAMVEKSDCTELQLTQTQVPEDNFDETESGWKKYYFESMKRTFGFGAQLF